MYLIPVRCSSNRGGPGESKDGTSDKLFPPRLSGELKVQSPIQPTQQEARLRIHASYIAPCRSCEDRRAEA